MTKKERVLAALQGRASDGIPCCFTKHFHPEEASGEAGVNAHLHFFRQTDTDICKIMNENLVPDVGEIRCAEDWKKIPTYGPHEDFVERQIDFTEEILDKCQEEAFMVGTLHGSCASSIHPIEKRYGYEAVRRMLCEHLRENSTVVLDAFKRIAQVQCTLAHRYIEAGLDGVYYSALGGEFRYYTDAEFAQAVAALDKMILDEIHKAGGVAILHMCKDGLNMERFRPYRDWADVFNWGISEAPMSLAEGREMFGKTILGGLSNKEGPLVEGDAEHLKAEIEAAVQKAGQSCFILGADCTMPIDLDLHNIRMACNMAHGMQLRAKE